MNYLGNAFSLNMLDGFPVELEIEELSRPEAASFAANARSVVGHADTAAVFESVLGVPVATNRATLMLKEDDFLLVGQYSGPRLPEGATVLPEGASIRWLLVTQLPQ